MLIPGSLLRFGIALFSATLVCAGAPAGAGYLARVGPAPLRFRVDSVPRNPAEVLPPLKMADDRNDARLEFHPQVNEVEPVATFRGEEDVIANLVGPELTPPIPAPAPSENIETTGAQPMGPQMLLHFFDRSSTNQPIVISMPVPFMPPPPPVSRSSAVYIKQ